MDHVPLERQHDGRAGAGRPPLTRAVKRGLLIGLLLLAAAAFTGLGLWQVERRAWKLDLIEKVDARIHADPVPLPDANRWPGFDAKAEEYRRVSASGTFLHDRETLVQALTERGGGYWVLTPLVTAKGVVLINRGFVPSSRRDPATRAEGQVSGAVTVTGLLRASEPGGGFLRRNAPDEDRWYSRDVTAIAKAHELSAVAPFFVDADSSPNPGGYPIGGLTVIRFRNAHLEYALTWFALAVMSMGAAVFVIRRKGLD